MFGEQQRYYTFIKRFPDIFFDTLIHSYLDSHHGNAGNLSCVLSGAHTDVVNKELYEFQDKRPRSRPQARINCWCDAFMLENFQSDSQPVYLFYIEPHFRYDRPQKVAIVGFIRWVLEIIGERDPVLDAENIHMAVKILSDCGLKWKFTKNQYSRNAKEREAYVAELQAFSWKVPPPRWDRPELASRIILFVSSRFQNPDVRDRIPFAPKLKDFMKKTRLPIMNLWRISHYFGYWFLSKMQISFVVSITTVMSYLNVSIILVVLKILFVEVVAMMISRQVSEAKNTIPAGFAIGVERLIDAMIESGLTVKNKDTIDLYFIQVGEEAKNWHSPEYQGSWDGSQCPRVIWFAIDETQLKNKLTQSKICRDYWYHGGSTRCLSAQKYGKVNANRSKTRKTLWSYGGDIIGEKESRFYDPTKELIQAK